MSKLVKCPLSPDDWRRLARRLIRMHMTMLGWRYSDLARALVDLGVQEEELLLKNRIALGRFRATLFLQCLMAMGVDELRLPLIVDAAGRDRDDSDDDRGLGEISKRPGTSRK